MHQLFPWSSTNGFRSPVALFGTFLVESSCTRSYSLRKLFSRLEGWFCKAWALYDSIEGNTKCSNREIHDLTNFAQLWLNAVGLHRVGKQSVFVQH